MSLRDVLSCLVSAGIGIASLVVAGLVPATPDQEGIAFLTEMAGTS